MGDSSWVEGILRLGAQPQHWFVHLAGLGMNQPNAERGAGCKPECVCSCSEPKDWTQVPAGSQAGQQGAELQLEHRHKTQSKICFSLGCIHAGLCPRFQLGRAELSCSSQPQPAHTASCSAPGAVASPGHSHRDSTAERVDISAWNRAVQQMLLTSERGNSSGKKDADLASSSLWGRKEEEGEMVKSSVFSSDGERTEKGALVGA